MGTYYRAFRDSIGFLTLLTLGIIRFSRLVAYEPEDMMIAQNIVGWLVDTAIVFIPLMILRQINKDNAHKDNK